MTRIWLEHEPHDDSKIFKMIAKKSGEGKVLEIYEYRLPLGTNIYEIYDSKDSTH